MPLTVNLGNVLSVCYEPVAFAWRRFLVDLDEIERPKSRMFERQRVRDFSEMSYRSS